MNGDLTSQNVVFFAPAARLYLESKTCVNHSTAHPALDERLAECSSGPATEILRALSFSHESERNSAVGLAFVFLGCVDLSEGSRRYRGTVPFLRLLQISKTLATGGRTRANLATGVKGSVPSDFFYTTGANAWVTRWLTRDFDLAGQQNVSEHRKRHAATVSCKLRIVRLEPESRYRDAT